MQRGWNYKILVILTILLWLNPLALASTQRLKFFARDTTENAANELIRRLIKGHKENDPTQNFDYSDFQRYEKVVISLSGLSEIDTMKTLSFLNDYIVENPYSSRSLLPMSLHEKIYRSTRGRAVKRDIDSTLYSSKSGIDDRLTETSVFALLDDMMPQVDLFSEKFDLAHTQFISPLSRNAMSF